VAARWAAGAEGERRTAQMLTVLGEDGGGRWGGWYDRALPGGGRANADHVLLPPSGACLVLVDSKLWSARRGPVAVRGGRLVHGQADRQSAMDAVLHETRILGMELEVPVVTIIAVHNAPVAGGQFTLQGVEVLEASRLVPVLRRLAGRPDPGRFQELAAAADAALPRYVEGGGR
jgi:hypothetical protein